MLRTSQITYLSPGHNKKCAFQAPISTTNHLFKDRFAPLPASSAGVPRKYSSNFLVNSRASTTGARKNLRQLPSNFSIRYGTHIISASGKSCNAPIVSAVSRFVRQETDEIENSSAASPLAVSRHQRARPGTDSTRNPALPRRAHHASPDRDARTARVRSPARFFHRAEVFDDFLAAPALR